MDTNARTARLTDDIRRKRMVATSSAHTMSATAATNYCHNNSAKENIIPSFQNTNIYKYENSVCIFQTISNIKKMKAKRVY